MAQAAAHGHSLDGERWCLVRASGEIDLATESALARVLEAVTWHGSGPRGESHEQVVLDLTAVTFIDCSGLRPIIEARRRLADRFWLANPSRQVIRLLTVAGLADYFGFLPPPHQRTDQRRGGSFVITVVHDERVGACGYCAAMLPVTLLSAPSVAPSALVLCPACRCRASVALVRAPRPASSDS